MSRQERPCHETALHSPPRDGQASVEPPSDPTVHRTWDELLAATITALTAAARLQLPARDPNGREESTPDETRTEPIDWAEFVTLALTGAVANLGGVSRALQGRPGSWEAQGLRGLLQGAVGDDPVTLLRHRTEPLLVVLRPAEILADLGYDAVYDESQRLLSGQQHQQVWRYQLQDGRNWQPLDVDAPPYEEPASEYARPGDVMVAPALRGTSGSTTGSWTWRHEPTTCATTSTPATTGGPCRRPCWPPQPSSSPASRSRSVSPSTRPT